MVQGIYQFPSSPNAQVVGEHLSQLGYKKGDIVYLRGFFPSNDPRKEQDKGRKSQVKSLDQLIKIAFQWQKEGRGVYLVVNGGGHTDDKVTQCRAIFYEHDNLDKEIQRQLWQSLGLPEPTLQIDTGGKSIHSYWVFSEQITPEQWKILQTDLLEFADGDRALKNPSRVMRLAGCYHSPSTSENISEIIHNSGKKYSFEELRAIIPTKEQAVAPKPQQHPAIDDDWADMRKISQYLEGYKPEGRKGWITCKCPVHGGQSLDSLHINEATGQFHCHSGCDNKEVFRVSLEIAKSKGHIAPEKHFNHSSSSYSSSNNKTVSTPTPTSETLTKEQLFQEIDQLIEQELPKSELGLIFPDLAKRTTYKEGTIAKLYWERRKEKQQAENREEASKQIPSLLEAQQARLDPYRLLWGDGGRFAHLLQKTANAMPTCVESLITTLIPTVGSRMGTEARIIIKPLTDYWQPPIFWSCVVARSGRIKTPAQKIIIAPLNKLEAQEYNLWLVNKEQYEDELKLYKPNSGEEPPTKPAPRKRYIIQNATSETRIKLHSQNRRGILYYRDEWSGFINSRNKYRNGKGDDLELELSEYNGDFVSKDVSDADQSIYLEQTAISRTGNTQTDTLKRFLSYQNFADYTGEFARWLFCLVPSPIAYIDLFEEDDGTAQALKDSLSHIYKTVGQIQNLDLFLDNSAKKICQRYMDFLAEAEDTESHPGLKTAYPKLKSYFARFALWLHVVNAILAGTDAKSISQFVDEHTMSVACELTDFYLAQFKVLYGGNDSEAEITGTLLKIKEYIEKHSEGVTVRNIKRIVKACKNTPSAEILANCESLVNSGAITSDGKKFYPLSKGADKADNYHRSLTLSNFGLADNMADNRPTKPTLSTEEIIKFSNHTDVGPVGPVSANEPTDETWTGGGIQQFVGPVGHSLPNTNNEPQQTATQNESVTALTVGAIYEVYKGLEWIPCYLLQQNNSECYFVSVRDSGYKFWHSISRGGVREININLVESVYKKFRAALDQEWSDQEISVIKIFAAYCGVSDFAFFKTGRVIPSTLDKLHEYLDHVVPGLVQRVEGQGITEESSSNTQ
ncbi:MAG TPA: DUF3987 domain-containing protein, partial [Nostocaceae cyanobacterium]|nr:DUF3987 domain-containing protein [Nostocaceae cyanobacterium]